MKEKDDYSVVFIGNYFNPNYGASYDGAVFSLAAGCCTTLLASNANGNVFKFIEVRKDES